MVFYCDYNLWNVDCGCIIDRSIGSLKVSVWRIDVFETYNVLSTCGYFWTISILCTSSLCDCLHLHHDCVPFCGKLLFYIWGGTKSSTENTQKYSKIVVGLTVVFLISYVAYYVLWTYIICTEEESNFYKNFHIILQSKYKLRYMYLISTCLLSINSCLNPVALFCTSSSFRQHLKCYLTCFCKTNSVPTDLELKRRNWVCNHFLYFLQLHLD